MSDIADRVKKIVVENALVVSLITSGKGLRSARHTHTQ